MKQDEIEKVKELRNELIHEKLCNRSRNKDPEQEE